MELAGTTRKQLPPYVGEYTSGQGSPRDRFFQQPMAVLPELFPDALGSPAASEASKAEAPAPAEGRAMQCLEHRYQAGVKPTVRFTLLRVLL